MKRIASLVTAAILALVLYFIVSRIFFVVVVQMPWYVLLGLLVVLCLAIEHYVHKALGTNRQRYE